MRIATTKVSLNMDYVKMQQKWTIHSHRLWKIFVIIISVVNLDVFKKLAIGWLIIEY